jgi:glucose-1-phosphate adenylyltransferase
LPSADLFHRPTSVVLLAGGDGARLHELATLEAKPALPMAGRRIVDFAVARAVAAGIPRMIVVLPRRGEALMRHLREAWGDRIALTFRDRDGAAGTAAALGAALEGEGPRPALVLPADQIHTIDLDALLRAHGTGGASATVLALGGPGTPAPCVLDPRLLARVVGGDVWADLLAGRDDVARLDPPEGAYWRDVNTLDDLRTTALEVRRAPPCPLPDAEGAPPDAPEEPGRDLALEIGGLRLSAPRFGARHRGRWTLIEDSLVLRGARVAPGARLSRAIVAPGAVVPANLVVGDDPEEDARWFRVTPGGTTLVTAPMLAARAAARMRAQLGDRLPAALMSRKAST